MVLCQAGPPCRGVANACYFRPARQNFNGEFHGNSSVEAAATFQCVNGTKTDGVACRWPGNSDVVHLGEPLVDAVWRSNHALHPTVMATQEPLWNDTVMRYEMLQCVAGGLADRLLGGGAPFACRTAWRWLGGPFAWWWLGSPFAWRGLGSPLA